MTEADRTCAKATASDVLEVLGPMSDDRVAAVLETGATVRQIEEAAAWATGESDVMGELRRPVAGPVAAVYEILTADELLAEDRD